MGDTPRNLREDLKQATGLDWLVDPTHPEPGITASIDLRVVLPDGRIAVISGGVTVYTTSKP